jgi:signal transduction histidine kinase/CheY-like chemotaxis protein
VPARIGLTPAQFNALFPFHFAFDATGTLVSAGQVLARICPAMAPGQPVAAVASIDRPAVPFTIDAVRAVEHTLVILHLKVPAVTLRGEFLVDDDRGLALFVGSPWITHIDEATSLGLSLSDFASHDSLSEFLLLFKTQQLALADAEALADRLLTQRAELRVANLRLATQERRLREQNDELLRAGRLKDEFLSGMSHELRTPLNAVIGMSESLKEGTYGDLSDDQTGAVSLIESSGQHLLSLINDILDLSRIEADRFDLEVADTDVHAVCRAAMAMVRSLAHKKHITLQLAIDPEAESVRADERRLKQVLVNLLSNAVKFTHDGGAVRLTVTGEEAAGRLLFAVADTGIGIAADDLPRLFQPFSQLDSALNRRHTGTGLGLALTKRMVELHGGFIDVASVPGQGSTFSVVLPWTPQAATVNASPEREPMAHGIDAAASPSRHLLLVDDNPGNQQVLADFLRARGFEVQQATSAEEGLAAARTRRPALVLMDVQMPAVDGLEATRQLRADPDLRSLPVVALTSLAMKGDRERCLAAGMDDYLSKPVKLTELLATIERLLGAPRVAA